MSAIHLNLLGEFQCLVSDGQPVNIALAKDQGRIAIVALSEGKLIASKIPGAQFVTLNSRNHMVFEDDLEFPKFLHYLREFMSLD